MPVENALAFLRSLDGARVLPDAILVLGPHAFLREFVVASAASSLVAQGFKYRSFQVASAADFDRVLDEINASDLFAQKRLVVCRVLKSHRERAEDERAPDDAAQPGARAAAAGGETALAQLLESGIGSNRLLLVYERDSAPARIRKVAEKSALMVNCMRPFDNQLPDYAAVFARRKGLKLAAGAAEFLVNRHGGDLAAVANALDKAAALADSSKPVSSADLDEPGGRKIPDVFEIADSLARGRAADVVGQLDRALAFGRDPVEILSVEMIPVLRRMLTAAEMTARRRPAAEIAGALGGSPTSTLVTRAIDGARRFGLERLRRAFATATKLDQSFKNGTVKEREHALSALVLELMMGEQDSRALGRG